MFVIMSLQDEKIGSFFMRSNDLFQHVHVGLYQNYFLIIKYSDNTISQEDSKRSDKIIINVWTDDNWISLIELLLIKTHEI